MSKQSENQIPMHNPEPLDVGPMTPEEVRITRDLMEIPAIVAELRSRIAEVGTVVAHAADAADAEARTQLGEQIEFRLLGDAPGRLEDIWRMYDARLLQIEENSHLNDRGKREHRDRLVEEREAAIGEAFNVADAHAEALVKRASPPRPPAVTGEVSSHVQSIAATFGLMLPEDFVRGALNALSVAVDPAEPPEVREVHTAILAHAYIPLLRRRATQPEKFAEPYRSTNGQVLELVEEHIAARAAKHRAAISIRDAFRGTWRTLEQTARSTGRWDSFISDIAMGR